MTNYDEQQLAKLLKALPPAPEGWVRAAQELPRARRELDTIVERARADEEYRKSVVADLEAALRESGHEPDPVLVAALRARLADE
jgi:hypothetical protein